jgi:hypothetical protein
MLQKLGALLLGVALGLPLSMAQTRGPVMSPPFSRGPGFAPANHITIGFRGPSRHLSPGLWLGAPFWYGDYPQQPQVTEASAPQVVVVQAQPASPPSPEPKLAEPLLIELQGDRYVRLRGNEAAQQGFPVEASYARAVSPKASAAKHPTSPAPEPEALPPVELIYRDGHHADLHEYTIVDGTIYARGDYWTDGYWEKKIQISTLNLPATMKANQEHGVKFTLPTSPNEVVTRP